MLLLEFLPHSLSCRPPHQGWILQGAALEQGVTSHTKPQPDHFVFTWDLLWPCPRISAVTDNETLWQFYDAADGTDDVHLQPEWGKWCWSLVGAVLTSLWPL